jgi:centractin
LLTSLYLLPYLSLSLYSFVGRKVEDHRGALLLSRPIDHGRVRDWSEVELLWRAVYEGGGSLSAAADAHPALVTMPPLSSRASRDAAAALMFEMLRAPALLLAPTSTLALYATGRTTGLVLECGEGVTAASPIYEGFALPHAVVRSDLGGGEVTDALSTLLRRAGCALSTTAERETVRLLKETCGGVAISKESCDAGVRTGEPDTYRLPDGSRLSLAGEPTRACEVLFRPSLVGLECAGVADAIALALSRTDLDLRRAALSGIVLSGGATATRGFAARLLADVRASAPQDAKVKVWAPSDRKTLTWVGGSILASLSTFKEMWVTRAQWEEEGPRALGRFAGVA